MDGESWLLIIALVVVESILFNIYFETPFDVILSVATAAVIVFGAGKIEKYLDINNGSRNNNT